MAAITNIPKKLSDTVHAEKAPVIDELVEYMNNLDPPPTPEEVKKVSRKIDMRLPPFLFILYVFTWLDRGALGTTVLKPDYIHHARLLTSPVNAVLMNIREDLGFSSSGFALAVGMCKLPPPSDIDIWMTNVDDCIQSLSAVAPQSYSPTSACDTYARASTSPAP